MIISPIALVQQRFWKIRAVVFRKRGSVPMMDDQEFWLGFVLLFGVLSFVLAAGRGLIWQIGRLTLVWFYQPCLAVLVQAWPSLLLFSSLLHHLILVILLRAF